MQTRTRSKSTLNATIAALALMLTWSGASSPAGAQERTHQDRHARRLDAEAIGWAAGTKATTTKDRVVRIGWARDDVKVASSRSRRSSTRS